MWLALFPLWKLIGGLPLGVPTSVIIAGIMGSKEVLETIALKCFTELLGP